MRQQNEAYCPRHHLRGEIKDTLFGGFSHLGEHSGPTLTPCCGDDVERVTKGRTITVGLSTNIRVALFCVQIALGIVTARRFRGVQHR